MMKDAILWHLRMKTDITIKIGNSEIKESDYEKLLGITLDKKFNFKKHAEDFCR